MNIFFMYLGLFFVLIFVVVSIVIVSELQKRDFKITKKETGKVGILFYYWIISVNLALVSFIGGLIFKG